MKLSNQFRKKYCTARRPSFLSISETVSYFLPISRTKLLQRLLSLDIQILTWKLNPQKIIFWITAAVDFYALVLFVINRPGAERLSRQIFEPDLPPTCSRWMELAARNRRWPIISVEILSKHQQGMVLAWFGKRAPKEPLQWICLCVFSKSGLKL